MTEDGTATLTNGQSTLMEQATQPTLRDENIKAAAAIALNKPAATMTASRALVSDASGFVSAATQQHQLRLVMLMA